MKNHIPINFEWHSDSIFVDFFDSTDLTHNKLFLLGQKYGVSANTVTIHKLLAYLHKNSEVRYLMMEVSYSIGLMINDYLKNGDKQILVHALWNCKKIFTREYFDFFIRLREFNLNVGEDNAVEVVGINYIGGYEADFWVLNKIVRSKSIPADVYPTLVKTFYIYGDLKSRLEKDSVRVDSFLMVLKKFPSSSNLKLFDEFQLKSIPIGEIQVYVDFLLMDMPANTELYERFLGEDFFDFWMIIKNMRTRYDGRAQKDIVFQVNFFNLYPRLTKGNILGVLPRSYCHLNAVRFYSDQFAGDLNSLKTSPVKKKVLSIGTYYRKCRKYDSDKLYNESSVARFDVCPQRGVIIYKLNEYKTQFKKKAKDFPYLIITKEQREMQWLRPRYWNN